MGPAAWMVLEEAALSAAESEPGGGLWTPLSVRSVSASLGTGRGSATGALSSLVAAGLLRSAPGRRGAGGRFGLAGYWLTVPEGMVVVGVPSASELTAAGQAGHGSHSPANTRLTSTTALLPANQAEGEPAPRRGRRRPMRNSTPAVQASLFGSVVLTADEPSVGIEETPPSGEESLGAVRPDGCEVDDWVHELAPGVPAGADPHSSPSSDPTRSAGGSEC